MKKILIKIQDNSLVVKERIKLSTEYKSILNSYDEILKQEKNLQDYIK